jgi:hypothetical protein
MTQQEALAIADQAKPRSGVVFDKIMLSPSPAAAVSSQITALNKRFDGMSETVASFQKALDDAQTGIAIVEASNWTHHGRYHQ